MPVGSEETQRAVEVLDRRAHQLEVAVGQAVAQEAQGGDDHPARMVRTRIASRPELRERNLDEVVDAPVEGGTAELVA